MHEQLQELDRGGGSDQERDGPRHRNEGRYGDWGTRSFESTNPCEERLKSKFVIVLRRGIHARMLSSVRTTRLAFLVAGSGRTSFGVPPVLVDCCLAGSLTPLTRFQCVHRLAASLAGLVIPPLRATTR